MFIKHGGHVLLIDSPSFPVVLGHGWLIKHNSRINWGSKLKPIKQWGPKCISHCSSSVSHGSSHRDEDTDDSDEDWGGGVNHLGQ